MKRILFSILPLGLLLLGPPTLAKTAQAPVIVEIADVGKSKELAEALKATGVTVIIPPKNMRVVDEQTNCVVWIGKDVPLETLQTVMAEALPRYKHLQFFYVVGDKGEQPPEKVHNTIHIGGSIEAALVKKLSVISQDDFTQAMATAKNNEELHHFLHLRNETTSELQKPQ
jgi:hypothetical protein